ncbi:hypothetical protein TNCV_2759051 [Trichonephila clavipes]|nr:hypothetical protein TNCV_2759051 [Trichonephila clavipes]
MGLSKITDVANVVHHGLYMKEVNYSCGDAFGRIDVLPLSNDLPDEPNSYQQCLPNYCSVNVAVSGRPKQMPGSCTYNDCFSSATNAGICITATGHPQSGDG